jgi:hypothetical protein
MGPSGTKESRSNNTVIRNTNINKRNNRDNESEEHVPFPDAICINKLLSRGNANRFNYMSFNVEESGEFNETSKEKQARLKSRLVENGWAFVKLPAGMCCY